jgi:hypothetical protein
MYVGATTWGAKKNSMKGGTRGRQQARPEGEWIRAVRPELALLSDDLFARAQARIAARASAFVRSTHGHFIGRPRFAEAEARHLLSGLLECALCGHALGPVQPGGNRRVFYTCSRYHRVGVRAGCRNGLRVNQEALDHAVLQAVAKALDAETVRAAVKETASTLTARHAEAATRRSAIRAELLAVASRERKLLDAIADGDGAVADAIRGRLREELGKRDRLTAELARLDEAPTVDVAKVIAEGRTAPATCEARCFATVSRPGRSSGF